jgi:hypothetical protein
MFATAFLCCVSPIAQQKIVRSELTNTRAASRICWRPIPQPSVMSSHATAPSDAANSANRFLRVFESRHARFGQRVDVDDATAASLRGLQRRQHARVVRPRILSDDEDRLRLRKVVERDRAFADAD